MKRLPSNYLCLSNLDAPQLAAGYFTFLMLACLLVAALILPACGPKEEAPPAEEPKAEEPAAGELSFEAAEYANADYGFTVKYPKDWMESETLDSPTKLFAAQLGGQVPALLVDAADGATFADALLAAQDGYGAVGVTHPVGFGEFPEALGCVHGIGFFLFKIVHLVGYHPVSSVRFWFLTARYM